MHLVAVCVLAASIAEATHIIKLDKDFSKVITDQDFGKDVADIVNKIKTFKVSVHPRIYLFYKLLKKAMLMHADMHSDALYVPNKYNKKQGERRNSVEVDSLIGELAGDTTVQ